MVLVVFVLGVILYMSYYINSSNRIIAKWDREYPLLGLESELNSKVVNVVCNIDSQRFREDKNSIYVQTANGDRYRVVSGYLASEHDISLKQAVQLDMILVKEKNSDTLLVFQILGTDTVVFKFKLLDDLHYPLSSNGI